MKTRQAAYNSVAIGLLWSTAGFASYQPYETFEMVGGAELIVAGKIESLTDKTFTLRVHRVLAGKHERDTVEVRRFVNWACSWRYGAYEVGQEMIVFLVSYQESAEDEKTVYQTMGSGCQSEFPIRDGMAYCYVSISVPESKKARLGSHDEVLTLPAGTVYSAIAGYRTLYKVTLGTFDTAKKDGHSPFTRSIERLDAQANASGREFRPRRAAPTMLERLRAYAGQSILHHHLVDSTEKTSSRLGMASVGWKAPRLDETPMPTIIPYSKDR